MIASQLRVKAPPKVLEIEEKLVWKYKETRHATKPTSFETFIILQFINI